MVEDFRKELKDNGQSLKWFYDSHIKDLNILTYGGFCHQLNGYAPIIHEVEKKIQQYLENKNG